MSVADSDGASPAAGEGAISLRKVVKRFGHIVAVDGLDLEVQSGVCFGLLGPNGAGKSTTMRMLTAQTLADSGEIAVLGYELPRESKQARMEMGVVPQLDNLDVELTCRQILTVFARLYRVPGAQRAAAVEKALELANLKGRADTIVRELSGGMRRRLLVARGLIHRPRLVLLDEPTVGLDPQVRQELWTLIDALRVEGVTVLMSTHYIEEAERLADVVAVMSHGRIVAQDAPARLVKAYAGERVLEVYGPPARLAEASEHAARRGWQSRRSGPALAIMRAETLDGDAPEGVLRPANLEDAFVALTGEEIE
ncbi:MAG: ABC transporter ATP-binding protein [Actinobacteria bacterium]|nr:MAG: ABC transporter ATP-binding protein [Actinomycetota bacterium]